MDYVPRNIGDSLTRWQTKSTWVLALSLIPLGGIFFAIIWGSTRDVRAADGRSIQWPLMFPIPNYDSLNAYLTVIGIFHSFVGYCVHELADRMATFDRTCAFRSRTSFVELLNDLPGSPYWQRYFKSNLTWKSLARMAIFYPALSTVGGVLYKQAFVLSTFTRQPTKAYYYYTFVTGCANDFRNCPGSRFLKYGDAMRQARFGGAHSMGIETTETGLRLTFVAAPTSAQLTSVQKNITSLRATSLAMVADYRNVSSDETLPIPINRTSGYYTGTNGSLAYHATEGLAWSFSAIDSGRQEVEPYQRVRGMMQFCVVQCEWRTVSSSLSLQNYTLTRCAELDSVFWKATDSVGVYGNEIAFSLLSDIVDENWDVLAKKPGVHPDILQSAYVVPAMYGVLVLGGWGYDWEVLMNNPAINGIFDSPVLEVDEYDKILVIEAKTAFVFLYLALLSAIFVGHLALGFFIQRMYVTEWAPLWIGLLTNSELQNIRQQIRDNNIFDSKGLKKFNRTSWESRNVTGEEAFLLSPQSMSSGKELKTP